MKDHRRLIKDTAAVMRVSYLGVFHIALAYKSQEDTEDTKKSAQWLLNKFIETGTVPDYIESFCLDVHIGVIPVLDEKGRQLNKRRKK